MGQRNDGRQLGTDVLTRTDEGGEGTATGGPVAVSAPSRTAPLPRTSWEPAGRGFDPLVGREELLARAGGALDRGRSVWLYGPRGIGKTRLLTALADTSTPTGRPIAVDDLDVRWADDRDEVQPVLAQRDRPVVVTTVQAPRGGAEGFEVIAVPPLDRLATGALVAAMLGEPIDPQLASQVWRAGGGHPGATRTLVLEAKEIGSVELGSHGWELIAPLPLGQLTELVEGRFADLTPESRAAAELLAFGSPLPAGIAARLLDPAAMRELACRDLVRLPTSRGGGEVALAEPLDGEVLRSMLPRATRRARLKELAAAFEAAGWPETDDASLLRVARWRLEVGGWSPDAYARAAVAAVRADDPRLVARALRRVVSGGGNRPVVRLVDPGEPHGLVGEALDAARRGAVTRAEAALEALGEGTSAEAEQAGADEARAGQAGADEACAGQAGAEEPAAGDRHDDRDDVTTAEVGPLDTADERVRGPASLVEGFVAFDRLDPDRFAQAQGAAAAFDDVRSVLARRCLTALDTLGAGATPLPERLAASRAELDTALRGDGGGRGLWLGVHGQLLARRGDLRQGYAVLVAAVRACERRDPWKLRPLVVASLAEVAASIGNTIEAEQRLLGIADRRATDPRVDTRARCAEAMIAAQRDGEAAGRPIAIAAGDAAAADGRGRDAVEAWHLAVRLGADEGIVDRLRLAGLPADHPLVEVVRAHAAAVASGDADQLDAVARRFATDGLTLIAAEVAVAAARQGHDRAGALASGLLARCPDARTPAVEGQPVTELSDRRREVAGLAAAGHDGRSIARRLGVSGRTVENHLTAIYRQLGVRSRRELVEIHGPTEPWRVAA